MLMREESSEGDKISLCFFSLSFVFFPYRSFAYEGRLTVAHGRGGNEAIKKWKGLKNVEIYELETE